MLVSRTSVETDLELGRLVEVPDPRTPLARPLGLEERRIARKSFDKFQQYYAEHPEDAARFLDQGDRKPDPSLPSGDYAALAMVTSQLLNLDEVLNK